MTNPEALPVSTPEFTPKEKELLSIDQLDDWRSMQHGVLSTLREKANFGEDYPRVFTESVDDALGFYLNEHEVAEDSPKRDELTDLYRSASIDRIHEDEWLYRPSSRGEAVDSVDDMSERQAFESKIAVLKGEDLKEKAEISSAHEEALRMNERWDALQTEVPEAREKLAKLAAKRQGRLFGNGGEAYHEAKQTYDAKVIELGQIQFSDSREMFDQMTEAEKNDFSANVTGYLVDEQQKLREETTENLKGTKVGKFVDWMQSGTKARRIRRGIYLGVGGALVGAGASALLAGAGLVAGAGVAAVGVSRFGAFARGYASRDKRGMGELQDQHKRELQDHLKYEHEGLLDKTHARTEQWYENDSRGQQIERRRAVGKALAIMGVGATIGEGIHMIAGSVDLGSHHTAGNTSHTPAPSETHGGGSADTHTGPHYLPGTEPHTGLLSTHDVTGGGATHAHSALNYFSGHSGTTEFSAGGTHNFESWMNGSNGAGYTVKPGDTVWGLSQKYLETHGVKHPSVYQTDAVKDQMLKTFQAKGFADHRGWLTAGAKVKF